MRVFRHEGADAADTCHGTETIPSRSGPRWPNRWYMTTHARVQPAARRANRRLPFGRRVCVLALTSLVVTLVPTLGAPTPSGAATLSVRVQGNKLVDQTGKPIRLLGVNFSGTEYACAEGWGIFDGPTDANAIAAIASWKANAVRVPLNEHCWLGINGAPAAYSGRNYRSAIAAYVQALNNAGLYAVLDLHWNAPGSTLARRQQPMADADHSPTFWSSVATYFKANPAVVFDLYNEPHVSSWECWRNGCTTSAGWKPAGMQTLVNAVRSTGARQPVIANGNNYANDLTSWLTYRPSDPAGQLVAGFHSYNDNFCNNVTCWNKRVGTVAASFPVVTGELGQNDCAHGYVDSFMNWADATGVSYLGWSWNPFSCTDQPALITSYNGTPTNYGIGIRDRLRALAAAGTTTTTAPTTTTKAPTTTTTIPSSTTTTTAPSTTTTVPAGSIRYDFEAGTTQGWHRAWGPVAVGLSSAQVRTGTTALAIYVNPTGTDLWPAVEVNAPPGLASGKRVTYWIYQPYGSTLTSVQPYVSDLNWNAFFTPEVRLATGWNQVSWTVPAVNGISAMGLQLNDDRAWQGQILLDSVIW